ncbi:MAG TPA: NADPH-dependent FMN reductase [Thermoanaerobaculia bacterium]|nr:NADPH-dependent FMN reductase [Thermoanaerobaculia bacterium]
MRILAISGSLRDQSTNSRLLRAAKLLAPPDLTIELYAHLGELPHFNPDLDEDEPPPIVAQLREAVGAADALLLCSPEYAHGVPGTLKNALDWLVASREMPGKIIALVNASGRAVHAQAQLAETLRTMATQVLELTIALDGRRIDEQAMAADAEIAARLLGVFEAVRTRAAASSQK